MCESLRVAQGQKGEPGLILGPDGTPRYLGGLTGQPVKTLTNELLGFTTITFKMTLCFGFQGDVGPPGPLGPQVRATF